MERFCREDVRDLSLTQAFYKLLDENKEYWCSLSTLYRLFRARGLNARRAPTRKARLRSRPTAYSAEKPNEVWTWDITYLRSSTYTGWFYYAYVIVDVYSRMVVSARVFDADNADFAVRFLGDAFRKYGIRPGQLVVHSDNGASMKAAPTWLCLRRTELSSRTAVRESVTTTRILSPFSVRLSTAAIACIPETALTASRKLNNGCKVLWNITTSTTDIAASEWLHPDSVTAAKMRRCCADAGKRCWRLAETTRSAGSAIPC